MTTTQNMLNDVLEELRQTDCQSVRAWENLIDARRAAPWHVKAYPRPQTLDVMPIWNGDTGHACETVEVWANDVGMGDLIMLAPAIRLAQKRARVRLWTVPKLQWLLNSGFFGPLIKPALTGREDVQLKAGLHCSVMDLPGILGINAAAMEAERATFRPRQFQYREQLEPGAWSALTYGSLECNPDFHDQGKRPQGAVVRHTLNALGTTWVQIAASKHAFDAEFACAAGSFRACVTVDTATAHVAGTLGIPTVVMLHERPNWRWGSYVTKQTDCPVPWYGPHVRACSWQGSWPETARAAVGIAQRLARESGVQDEVAANG